MPSTQMRGAPVAVPDQDAEVVRRDFEAAVRRVSGWKGPAVTAQDQLVLYGLYKQACFGDCHSQRPGLFDPTGRAKWASWRSYGGLGATIAMQRYSQVAEAMCPESTASSSVSAGSQDISDGGGNPRDGGEGQSSPRASPQPQGSGEARYDGGDLTRQQTAPTAALHGATVSRSRHLNGDTKCVLEPMTAAASGRAVKGSAERVERRRDFGQPEHPRRCPQELSSGARQAGIGEGGGKTREIGGARVYTIIAVAAMVVAAAIAVARGGDKGTGGTNEGQQELGGSGATSSGGWMAGRWSGAAAAALLLVLSASAAMAVVSSCLWCAVRVARWREEIFAGSPVVGEALSRVVALDRDENQGVEENEDIEEEGEGEEEEREEEACRLSSDGSGGCGGRDRSSGCNSRRADGYPRRKSGMPLEKESIEQDPIGNIFRPGTRASHDFSAPCSVRGEASAGGGAGGAGARSRTATPVAAENGGAVVFLTGVTGLVGQMVLFDLLKQGAAASTTAPAEKDQGSAEERGVDVEVGGEDGAEGGREDVDKVAARRLRRVVVLVRSKKGASPAERLASIRDSPMFRPLRESGAWADDANESNTPIADTTDTTDTTDTGEATRKVGRTRDASPRREEEALGGGRRTLITAVEGELGKEGLGLSGKSQALLARVGVTHALHCAASVSFSDPLAEAAATNVTGALRVAALVACWPSCGTLVHVSTAFVHGDNSGTPSSPLPQELPDLGGRNPERLYRSAQCAGPAAGGAAREAVDAMSELGYPNTYTFTKALGEHLLARALSAHNRRLDRQAAESREVGGDVGGLAATGEAGAGQGGGRGAGGDSSASLACPRRLMLRVVRPSIVGPSWVFPWPGWTGEQPSTVTGCQVLVLQRAVKTFRLGPHPAPIIPVDVVSRAIVHSALGWGGPLTAAAAVSPPAAVTDVAIAPSPYRRHPRNLPGFDSDASVAAAPWPEVVIRNLAWATHPVPVAVRDRGDGVDGTCKGRAFGAAAGAGAGSGGGGATVVSGRRSPVAEGLSEACEGGIGDGGGAGRMPSFREISGLLYDYAVLRGLRPSFEALAMRSSFAAASVLPAPPMAGGSKAGSSPLLGNRDNGDRAGSTHQHSFFGLRWSSRSVFDSMHLLLDRSPVWALRCLASAAERLGVCLGSSRSNDCNSSRGKRRRGGMAATLRRLDKLAALPAVYETFTWRQYSFDSALRVPDGLSPEGYALETALASELLQRSLPGGAEAGAKASPERRRAILRELGLQIRTHRSGGLRCGDEGGVAGSIRGGGAPGADYNGAASGNRQSGEHGDGGDNYVEEAVVDNTEGGDGGGDSSGGTTALRPLGLLCGRADRFVPWPAVAWWAATLPGSAARGGVTIWVRLVAYAVRVVMSRAASVVAVDVHSFRAAAPPGRHGEGLEASANAGVAPRRHGRRKGGSKSPAVRRGEEIKEDGAAPLSDVGVVGGAGSVGGGGAVLERPCSGGDDRDSSDCRGMRDVRPRDGEEVVADADGRGDHRAVGHEAHQREEGARGGKDGGAAAAAAEKVVVVLLPTHRSYLDFVLVSLFCASMRSLPGLSWLRVPKVAAADGPFGKEGTPLRWLMEKLGAFFVKRGRASEPHSALQRRLRALQEAADYQEEHQKDFSGRGPLEGRGGGGDAIAPGSNIAVDQDIAGVSHLGGGEGTGTGEGGRWPGPCESDPRQRGLETFEVFVEGTRSRDRRFLAPRTGLIRALQGAREGATLWLVPVSISYERVPEQERLAEELLSRARDGEGGGAQTREQKPHAGAVGLTGLLRWTIKALCGRVQLGRVLMRAEDPVVLNPGGDVRAALSEVRQRHRAGTVVTPYHIREASTHLGLDEEDVRDCVHELGGTVWEETTDSFDQQQLEPASTCDRYNSRPSPPPPSRYRSDLPSAEQVASAATPPSSDTEAWMSHLQWLHLFHDRLRALDGAGGDSSSNGGSGSSERLLKWADWLVPPQPPPSGTRSAATAAAAASPAHATVVVDEEDREEQEGSRTIHEPVPLRRANDLRGQDADFANGNAAHMDGAVSGGAVPDAGFVPISGSAASHPGAVGAVPGQAVERADVAGTSPRSTTQVSSASSSPSWVMTAAGSTSSSSSTSSSPSPSPSSLETTQTADEEGPAPGRPTPTTTTMGGSPMSPSSLSTSLETAPPDAETPPPLETAPSVHDRDGGIAVTAHVTRNGDHNAEERRQQAKESPSSPASQRVLAAVLREFARAEADVAKARRTLLEKEFSNPSRGHVLQVLLRSLSGEGNESVDDGSREADAFEGSDEEGSLGGWSNTRRRGEGAVGTPSAFLASVALSLGFGLGGGDECDGNTREGNPAVQKGAEPGVGDDAATDGADGPEAGVRDPGTAGAFSASSQRRSGRGERGDAALDGDDGDEWFGAANGDREAVGSWGFRDSGFCLESDRMDGGDPYVVMRGNRYGICGRPLRGLLPFVREAVGVPISPEGRARRATTPQPPSLPPSRLLQPKPASLDARPGTKRVGSDIGGGAIRPACSGDGGGGGGGRCLAGAESEWAVGEEGRGGQHTGTLLESMIESLGPAFDVKEQVSFSRRDRARHGTGHGLSDVWSLRTGRLRRAPDAVVWPTSEDQVFRLMEWAGKEGVCLIPFGGGTSVTRALEVPPLDVEPRPVVSVDMRKMSRVLDVDVANGTAHIQAGVVGRKMAEELAERGVTMGHEPDSLEFSTLGGWVATRASGMKRGRYGNIEDLVLEVRVVTGRGLAWQHFDRAESAPKAVGAFSRTSIGVDLVAAMLGSEGCLGIITSVVVKVVPLPEISEHASFLFKDFQTGVAFCRELSRSSGRLGLASCRLLDNRQLRLGKAMKGDDDADVTGGLRSTLRSLVPKVQSAFIRVWKGWDWKQTSAVTMVFEGSRQEAAHQRREVSRIARCRGGLSGGASAGKSGYDLTFAIAYLRDFALLFDVLGESFETFVSWTALEGLCEKVRERVRKEHRKRGLRGNAFVTHRVTQLYPEGACVYFYLAIYAEGVCNPTGVFSELEEAARDEILVAGGSLSHHHGVGKSRAGFLSRVSSPVVNELVLGMKRALDPRNILGARNHLLAAQPSEGDRDES